LARLASVRAFAASVSREHDVAVLVNNAGLMAPAWAATEDGHETTWQVNALAPWLLSTLLLPSLRRAAAAAGGGAGSARLINIGSRLEKTGDASDLRMEADARRRFTAASREFNTFKQYGTSKLALTALTFEVCCAACAPCAACRGRNTAHVCA
jgi:NAD(P)-dependent dehydrogenase (short-subunit alcohol dehydrogenase family)